MTSPLQRLTPKQALALSLWVTIAIPAIIAARRDLATRRRDQVRGNYDLWRRLTWLPGPSIAYLIAARKPRDASSLGDGHNTDTAPTAPR